MCDVTTVVMHGSDMSDLQKFLVLLVTGRGCLQHNLCPCQAILVIDKGSVVHEGDLQTEGMLYLN